MKKAAPPAPDKAADELNRLAREQLTKGNINDAEQALVMSMSYGRTATNCRLMGNVLFLRRNLNAALPYFQEAITLDDKDHASHAMIAEIFFQQLNLQAIGFSMMAINLAPQEHRYKERFIHFSPHFNFKEVNPYIEATIIECLKVPEINAGLLQSLWHNMFSQDPIFTPFYKTFFSSDPVTRARASTFKRLISGGATNNDYVFFDEDNFARQKDLKPLLHPYFLLGLLRLVVINLPFEGFLTALRRRLLTELDAPKLDDDDYITLCSALAHYCFETEYIFDDTEAERQKISALKAKIENSSDFASMKRELSIYACYAPLYKLMNSRDVEKALAEDVDLDETVEHQITFYKELQKKAATLPAATPIEDDTSIKVREQYEEFPYPRWKSKPRDISHEGAGIPLLEKGKKILIAGCGTGNEAAQISVAFPQSKILAVDLSRSSLAYGALKAEEFELNNITFKQADILKLRSLNETFDGIVSGGVLHHMKDPVEGWKTLVDILNPNGLMRISLYSDIARKDIAAAQETIIKSGYASTSEGMKAFRRDAAKILPQNVFRTITGAEDYYQMSMLRDLLFHVQEHRLTLPRIKEILTQLGLTFVKMIVSDIAMTEFQKLYPDDPEGTNLDNWHDFEQKHPDVFLRMYQFWCQKKR